MTAHAPERIALKIHAADATEALVSTTLQHAAAWVSADDLDKIQPGITRWGFAYLDGHPIDAKDADEIRKAIREASPVPECEHVPPCLTRPDHRAQLREDAAS